jgi:hypothetical protein
LKAKLLFLALIVVLIAVVWGLRIGNKSTSKPLPNDLQEQLVHSASFEALSLSPIPDSDNSGTNTDTLLRYPILGHVKIDDQNLRRELVNAISQDMANANHPPSACILEPRHGIRCIDGSNSVLMAICYRCGDVVLERNGKEEYFLIKMDWGLLSPASQRLFDKMFKETGIKTDSK